MDENPDKTRRVFHAVTGSKQKPERTQKKSDADPLVTTARERIEEDVAMILRTAVTTLRTVDEITEEEVMTARNRRNELKITQKKIGDRVRLTIEIRPRNRGKEAWVNGGTNRMDHKGRIFVPKRTREMVEPKFLYREINPNGKPPVIILGDKEIRPTEKLMGPENLRIDSMNRVTLTGFPGDDRLKNTELTFHVRGKLIIVLPKDTPEPAWELIDRFVQQY